MPTNTVSPAKLPIMIAAWLLVAVIALIGSGLAGKAHAQAGSDVIPSITLDSNQPGQLVITWATPNRHPPTTGSGGPTPAWDFCLTKIPTKHKEPTYIPPPA